MPTALGSQGLPHKIHLAWHKPACHSCSEDGPPKCTSITSTSGLSWHTYISMMLAFAPSDGLRAVSFDDGACGAISINTVDIGTQKLINHPPIGYRRGRRHRDTRASCSESSERDRPRTAGGESANGDPRALVLPRSVIRQVAASTATTAAALRQRDRVASVDVQDRNLSSSSYPRRRISRMRSASSASFRGSPCHQHGKRTARPGRKRATIDEVRD